MFDKSESVYQQLLHRLSQGYRRTGYLFLGVAVFFGVVGGFLGLVFVQESLLSEVAWVAGLLVVGEIVLLVGMWQMWRLGNDPEKIPAIKFLLANYASLAWVYRHRITTKYYGVDVHTQAGLYLCNFDRKKVLLPVADSMLDELITMIRKYSPRAVIGYMAQAEDVYRKDPKQLWDWVEGLRR